VRPGQESVWDYPRAPRLEPERRLVRILFADQTIARSSEALRVLETSHPPGIYIPRESFLPGVLVQQPTQTVCEWKGAATYFDVELDGQRAQEAAWSYERPTPRFAALARYVSVYPGRMQACYLDEERVQAQEGGFYGGWITSGIVGPFKGGPGSWGW